MEKEHALKRLVGKKQTLQQGKASNAWRLQILLILVDGSPP
jgi:hypothetical protein